MSEDRIEQYQAAYLADYGFESIMVRYRRRLLVERLLKNCPAVVVEVGCGSELLLSEWVRQGHRVEHWLVVEPGQQFAKIAAEAGLQNLHVINDFFEAAVSRIKAQLPRPPDLIICASLLHEVPSASELLAAICAVMGPDTLLHVNVPNATSLHRRVARSMALISDLKEMSAQNLKLFQRRVYDMPSLESDLSRAGLAVCETGGYLVKPFTHAQMLKISKVLEGPVLDGLYKLGQEMPQIASEIFAEARKSRDV